MQFFSLLLARGTARFDTLLARGPFDTAALVRGLGRFDRSLILASIAAGLGACSAHDRVLEPDPVRDAAPADAAHLTAGSDAGHSPAGNGGGGDGGDPPNDAGALATFGDGGPTVASDPDCDLNGVWIGRQLTRSTALGAGQFANNWYYLEFAQDGEQVVVTKHFDCGIEVHGSVTVKLSPATRDALMRHNLQAGRRGTMRKQGGVCAFSLERFWSVRGADEARFRPTGALAAQDIAQVSAANPLPTQDMPDGAQDWDDTGTLGVAWQITGITSGSRESDQRDWTEWFTDDDFTITPDQDWSADLVVRSRFNNEEKLFSASNALVATLSTADAEAKHTVTLRFLGRSRDDARARALIKASDSETCVAIQAAIPAASSL
jgi:hypothetical protein